MHYSDNEEKFRTALEEIREIYVGMEGFIPETCPEGYQQHILQQIYKVAVKALDKT